MILNQIQEEVLIDNFFMNSDYAGARNIAKKLLSAGNCVVAGSSCIWVGGIGNFIKTSAEPELIGCIRYTFDLEEFMSSLYFETGMQAILKSRREELKELSEEVEMLNELLGIQI